MLPLSADQDEPQRAEQRHRSRRERRRRLGADYFPEECYSRECRLLLQRKLAVAEEVEDEAQRLFEKEVPSGWIGEAVMKGLRELDQVAYVRFASVYRDFATLDELFGEMQREIDRRRLQDPAQQELFALWRARGADT